jgi:hypothetical protein
MYTCPHCGGRFWQPKDFAAVTSFADRLIERGRGDEAIAFVEREVAAAYGKRPAPPEETQDEETQT